MSLLKLKYKNSAYRPGFHCKYEPEYKTYIGQVLHFSWLSENEFALTTGEYDAPVRILDKRDIIEAWIDRSNRPDNVTIVDDKYVVTKGPFKRYSCTCTAYKWRHKCSHIDEVKRG
jgi:hypothetical protein